MKTLTVRDVPDAVYEVIVREAHDNHRSIQEQVRMVLAKEARLRQGGFLARARTWQSSLAGRDLGDTVDEIRQARSRQ